jgi:diacylglycerol kinase family enzyme
MRKRPAMKGLDYVQSRRFDVRLDTPQELELDGDAVGRVTAARLTVKHRALTLIVAAAQA